MLTAYESGELTDEQAAPIEDHLRECDRCRATLRARQSSSAEADVLRKAWQMSASASALAARSSLATADATGAQATAAPPGDPPPLPPLPVEAGSAGAGAWVVPDYERVQLCGEGAYGSVWVVRDRVGVYRAMKIVNLRKIGTQQRSANGERERQSLETYCRKVGRYPYLIQVHHIGIVGDLLYYTMELADNDVTKLPVTDEFPSIYRPLTLARVLQRRRIRPDTAAEIARRLLRGLALLHRLDLVHRDIKPANIVIVKRMPKLADIGMITVGLGAVGGGALGTPRYMPPDRSNDKSADIFALGKVLHEMMCGMDHPSFPRLPAEFGAVAGQWDLVRLADVIARACAPQSADRYASAGEMLDDLEACTESPLRSLLESMSEGEPAEFPTPREPSNRQLALAAIHAAPWVAGIVAGLIIVYWLLR
jgi:serine/threonine protein kinase